MRNNSQTVAPFAVNLNTTIRYHDKGKEWYHRKQGKGQIFCKLPVWIQWLYVNYGNRHATNDK